MKKRFEVRLNPRGEQLTRLQALQGLFVEACNSLAPLVAQTRCWNRVGLHHLAYRNLREQFPQLGSQMACNVIYSVSRAARKIYQTHRGPGKSEGSLPLIRFLPNAPVFFDRHTLSLKAGTLSLFTLDGRLKFQSTVSPEVEKTLAAEKIKEIVMYQTEGEYRLRFSFSDSQNQEEQGANDEPEFLVVNQSKEIA